MENEHDTASCWFSRHSVPPYCPFCVCTKFLSGCAIGLFYGEREKKRDGYGERGSLKGGSPGNVKGAM